MMNFVLNLTCIDHLTSALDLEMEEIVLHADRFSAAGGIAEADLLKVANRFRQKGRQVTLLWDRFCKNKEIDILSHRLSCLIDNLTSVRFADPGIGLFLKRQFPELDLQFLMWDGHQNLSGILKWIDGFKPGLQRIILSNQLSYESIKKLRGQTDLELEIKVLGRFQVFYSARRLLRHHISNNPDKTHCATAASKDRATQLFPVFETAYGTVIFNDKDLFLLDRLDDLKRVGIDYLGLEPHTIEQYRLLLGIFQNASFESLRELWDHPVTTGFFDVNRTDALLEKLTNPFLKDEKQQQTATVLETLKNTHTLIQLHEDLVFPCQVHFFTPERKTVTHQIVKLQDLQGNDIRERAGEGFYLLPWIKYVVPASIMKVAKISGD